MIKGLTIIIHHTSWWKTCSLLHSHCLFHQTKKRFELYSPLLTLRSKDPSWGELSVISPTTTSSTSQRNHTTILNLLEILMIQNGLDFPTKDPPIITHNPSRRTSFCSPFTILPLRNQSKYLILIQKMCLQLLKA